MSSLLLDTNALLWVLAADPGLGDGARARLNASAQVHFSAASVLEVTINEMLGRLTTPGELSADARSAGLIELPFRAEHASGLRDFPNLTRHDPFDRMLLSQANTEKLLLLTSDRHLLDLGLDWVVDARG